MKRLFALALAVTTLPGCVLWFGNDDDCVETSSGATEPAASIGFLDPFTGQCQSLGGGGGGGGGSTCGDFGGPVPVADAPAPPDWALCFSECTGLDEVSCQATPGCRAAYVVNCVEGADCQLDEPLYSECWQIAPSGPAAGEACDGLDAYSCSRHEDCVAIHYSQGDCNTDPSLPCPPPAGGDGFIPAPLMGNFASCAPESAGDPGSCYGEVYCDSLPPECPPNSVPGVGADGCWTGRCIPVEQCETPAGCADVASEAECIMRAECAPLYQGADCSCDAAGACGCQTWVYQACSDAPASL